MKRCTRAAVWIAALSLSACAAVPDMEPRPRAAAETDKSRVEPPLTDDEKSGDLNTRKEDDRICLREAADAERAHGIPGGMLQAVLIEASGGVVPSPFAVALNGQPPVDYATREDAVAKARRHAGNETLRLGCGQLQYVRHRSWLPLVDALDAKRSVAYLARWLARLKEKRGGWTEAVGESWSRHKWNHEAFVNRVACRWKNAGCVSPGEIN